MKQKTAFKIECRFLDPAWSNASVAGSHRGNVTWSSRLSLAFKSIAERNRLEFDPDSVHDGNYGPCLDAGNIEQNL